MTIIETSQKMREWSRSAHETGKTVGLVPTMGFLHAGHMSLVHHARTGRASAIVLSIFVNPTQFGPSEDFERYPRDIERDKAMADDAGVDVLFVPSVDDMYPGGARTFVEVEAMSHVMCGVTRPTHFRGVATVVNKLFNIVQPHVAVFGQKDAQQFLILRRMVHDLKLDIDMIMAPIVRESDGLAMSSRNVYLNPDERQQAVGLSQSLGIARQMVAAGETSVAEIIKAVEAHLTRYPLARLEYATIRDPQTLGELSVVQKPMLLALAVHFGKTRLIDNWIFA